MSALGLYVRIRTADLDRCLAIPAGDRKAFAEAWKAATLDQVDFGYSGYVLGSYFLAQGALNGIDDAFESPEATRLSNFFTGAFAARAPQQLPPLDPAELEKFCVDEWGQDGTPMREAILAAHDFFAAGMARVTEDEAVVFIIS